MQENKDLEITLAGSQKTDVRTLPFDNQTIEDVVEKIPVLKDGYDITVNSKIIPKDSWPTFSLTPEDNIVCIPNFGVGGIALAIMGLAAAPAVAFTGAYLTYVAIYAAVSIGISLGVGYLIRALTGTPKKAAEMSSQAYSWDPKTTQQQGQVEPKIFGKFPSLGNIIAGHVSISSDRTKLVMNALVSHGTGPVKSLSDHRINGQPASNFPDVTLETRRGLLEQTPITAFVPLKIQFRPNIDITNANELVWEIPDNDYDDIEVIIRHTVYHFNKDGSKKNQSLTYKIEVRELPAGGWQPVIEPTVWNTGTDAFWIGYKLSDWVTITRGKKYELQISKTSGDLSDEQKDHRQQELAVEFVSEVSDDALEYPGLVLVGVSGVLTDAFTGLQSISTLIEGQIVRQWDDVEEEWILDWTNNPGWVAGYTLTQPVISGDNPTNYNIEKLEGVPNERINWDDIKELVSHCDTECPDGKGGDESLITFNGTFDTAISTWNATLDVCRIARSVPVWRGNVVDFVIDKPTARTDVIAAGNILDGSFDETFLPKKDRVSAIDVAYNDINSNYDRVFLRTFSTVLPESSNVLTLDFRGIVKQTEAWRLAKFHQAYNDHIHRTIRCRADIDALTYKLGTVLGVQWDATNWNKLKEIGQRGSGRILDYTYDVGGDIITLDYDIEDAFEGGETYEILIRLTDSTQVLKTIASVVGNVVTIVGNYAAKPHVDDLWIVGLQNYVVKDFRLINRNRSKNISYELTLLEYNEDIWANDLLEPPVSGLYTTPAKSDSGSTIQPLTPKATKILVPQVALGTIGGGSDAMNTSNIKFVAVEAAAGEQKDYCDRQTLFFNFPHGTTQMVGQTITPTEDYSLGTIKFYAKYKYGSPGTCYVSLQETTAGLPNGVLLTDRLPFTVTADKVLKVIDFGVNPNLEIGIKYAIVWEAPDGVPSSGEVQLYGEPATGNYYIGGDRVWYDGSWQVVTTQDLNFYCWSLGVSDTIAWEAEDEETDILLNYLGETYVIDPGDTDLKYIYFDPDASETVLQTTDDQSVIVAGDFFVLCFNKEGVPYVQ